MVDDDEDDDEMDKEVGIDVLEPDSPARSPSPSLSPHRTPSPAPGPRPEPMDEDPCPTPPLEPEGVLPRSQERLCDTPAHVRHFGGRAGEPTLQPDTLLQGYKEYASKLSSSANNPYAPFHTCLDWEVAQWGKLRGPSSTSLTELLQIEGVCYHVYFLYLYCSLKYNDRLRMC